jgi:hypothetical protein
MSVFKRRTKLVSFRVSDEEYEKLQGACVAEGARSISEFARSALQRTVWAHNNGHTPEATEPVGSGAKELIDTMRELNRQLSQLVSLAQSASGRR